MRGSLTVSANEAAQIVGLSRTAFYHWRKRHGVKPVKGASTARPRYLRIDIERAVIGDVPPYSSEPADTTSPEWTAWVEEMQRLARKAADDAEGARSSRHATCPSLARRWRINCLACRKHRPLTGEQALGPWLA